LLNGNPFGFYISSCRNLWNWTLNRTTTPPNLKVTLICLKVCYGSIFPYPLEILLKGFVMWTIPTNYTILFIFSFLRHETPRLFLWSSSFSHHATFVTTIGCFQLPLLLASNLSPFFIYFKLRKAQKEEQNEMRTCQTYKKG
jgi:hypothetical protein